MKFIFAKVTNLFAGQIRQFLGGNSSIENDTLKATSVEAVFHRNSSGNGMFGILVSNDVAQGYLR